MNTTSMRFNNTDKSWFASIGKYLAKIIYAPGVTQLPLVLTSLLFTIYVSTTVVKYFKVHYKTFVLEAHLNVHNSTMAPENNFHENYFKTTHYNLARVISNWLLPFILMLSSSNHCKILKFPEQKWKINL